MTDFELTADEVQTIQKILADKSSKSRFPMTFANLQRKWSRFVDQVEQGYQDSIYEYTNDLSVRDVLQTVVDSVPPSLKTKLVTLLRDDDERFFTATQAVGRSLLPGKATGANSRWTRVPVRLEGELGEDLRAEGVIDLPT